MYNNTIMMYQVDVAAGTIEYIEDTVHPSCRKNEKKMKVNNLIKEANRAFE